MPSRLSPLLSPKELGKRLRQHRLAGRMSLRALAAATEFSPSFVSQVELGQVSPSIGSLQKLADSVGVTLGQLFEAGGQGGGLVVRRKDRVRLDSAWSRARIESLLTHRPGQGLEAILVTLNRGGRSGKRGYAPSQEEMVFVVSGRVLLETGGNLDRLRQGDTVSLPAGQSRAFSNPGPGQAQLLLVTSRR